MASIRENWGSRAGFILAASGSAVGLGNIWKFPYITGTNGGGWFVLIYIACILLVGLPLIGAEVMIGRAAKKNPVIAFEVLQNRKTGWSIIGWIGMAAAFLILSFYIVVAGWAMDYTAKHLVDFGAPVRQAATIASLEYESTTSIDDMRKSLVEEEAKKLARSDIAALKSSLAPSTWQLYDELTEAVPSDGSLEWLHRDRPHQQARAAVNHLEKVIEATRVQAARSVYPTIEALPDHEVRALATDHVRRQVIGEKMGEIFSSLATDGYTSTFWAFLFMCLTVAIVASGIGKGIETACKILMPTLIAMIVCMVIFAATRPGFIEGLEFVFKPDARALKPSGILEALGHSFFTLSLGMGALITYGSYQKTNGKLFGQVAWIAGLDTVIALLACMMIFPITFSFGQDPASGPGLIFISMPLAFAEIGSAGVLLGAFFFFLLTIAAVTSAISLLEVCTSYVIDRWNFSRARAALMFGTVIFLIGVLVAFSSSDGFIFKSWAKGFGMNFFDTFDFIASNWLLPAGGFLIAIYAGWVMPKRLRDAEVADEHPRLYSCWLFVTRFIAPGLVLLVLAQKIGLYDANDLLHNIWQ